MDIAAYEVTVCKECKELCDYYLDEFWNCPGDSEPCEEFFNRRTIRHCADCPMHDELEGCYSDPDECRDEEMRWINGMR